MMGAGLMVGGQWEVSKLTHIKGIDTTQTLMVIQNSLEMAAGPTIQFYQGGHFLFLVLQLLETETGQTEITENREQQMRHALETFRYWLASSIEGRK